MYANCLAGAYVTVRVNGEALTEHSTENNEKIVTTFVEAVAGAEFEVVLNLTPDFPYCDPADRISFQVTVDGSWVRDPIISAYSHRATDHVVEGPHETRDGVTTFRRLTFAQHASSDDQADKSMMDKLANVGQINVELKRCRKAGRSSYHDKDSKFEGVGDHAVPEKALKGRSISSHTELGRTESTSQTKYVKVKYPYGEDPIATYIFQYRSRRDLEIEGIIERTPSPVPLEERDPEELTPDELRELVRRSRAKKASANKVKQEIKREKRTRESSATLSNDADEGDVTVVSHSDRRKRARASMEGAEVIDLSDD